MERVETDIKEEHLFCYSCFLKITPEKMGINNLYFYIYIIINYL